MSSKARTIARDIKRKESKEEIYGRFDIPYDHKTGKIFHPVYGWINPLLVNGNEKIGKGAWHFSMLHGNETYHLNIALKTVETVIKKSKDPSNIGKKKIVSVIDDENPIFVDVQGTCACHCKGCYVDSGNYQYKTVLASLAIKTLIARSDIDFLIRAIKAQIIADKIELLRIHAAGDFFSIEYVQAWQNIVAAFPGVLFWTYTKVKEFENAFNQFDNANIVHSVIDGHGFNFGHCDYILNVYKFLTGKGLKVHICFCGIEKAAGIKAVHCTECQCCSHCDYVLFIEHSTEYKAEKDPLFPELVKIILAQEIQPKSGLKTIAA